MGAPYGSKWSKSERGVVKGKKGADDDHIAA